MPVDEISTDLEGKIAVVTGAAGPQGRAYAVMLARNGCRGVAVHYHSEHELGEAEETASEIAFLGAETMLIAADLTRVADVVRLFDEVDRRFGALDVVVNTVGKRVRKPLREITEHDFDATFALNSKAVFFVMREAAERLRNDGRIIAIGSSPEEVRDGSLAMYAASKAALDHFTRAMADELSGRGITVNMVAPLPMSGDPRSRSEPTTGIDPVAVSPTRGGARDYDEMTPVVEFLVGPGGGWVTAQKLLLNGGQTAH